jgi:DNA polymerase (family 10)
LAEKGKLPRLLELSDIKGDLHMHTQWSDGDTAIEPIVEAALGKGYKYIAITDHSMGLGITGGLDKERLHEQIQEIKALNQKYTDIRILTGMEIDIRANGTLDIPDDLLAEMDVVIASVHSSLNQPKNIPGG